MYRPSSKIVHNLIVVSLVAFLGTLGYHSLYLYKRDTTLQEVTTLVASTNPGVKMTTDEMYMGCRQKARLFIDDTLTRILSTDTHDDMYVQLTQNINGAFGALHGCEVLLAATLVNEESRQKINPEF